MKAVFDTNIVIDYLKGIEAAREELERHPRPLLSEISWMEVMVGASDDAERTRIRRFLARFDTLSIDNPIADMAVLIRRERRLRLPDAIIWATARSNEALLVTRNTRDFPADEPDIRVPYRL